MLAGIREFAAKTDWQVQSFEYAGKPFPVRDLISFWSPVGCIVEIGGNGITSKTILPKDFGKTPVVYLGANNAIQPKGATRIVNDAKTAGVLAAKELLSQGVRQYAFAGLEGLQWSKGRRDSFVESMRLNGKSVATIELTPARSSTRLTESNRIKRWLTSLQKPCGIFAGNDIVAETILSISRIAGFSIPDDISIIGVDDNESICCNTSPTLSSIRPDFRQGGRFAARLLARKILRDRNIPTETLFRTVGVVHRGSTRILRRHDADVAAALERIHSPDGASLTPHDILREFPCSRRNAEMRFRQATGRSVLDELMIARIMLAKDLLDHTNLSISAISERCGYRHSARLISVFKKSTGLTPLAWRRLVNRIQ